MLLEMTGKKTERTIPLRSERHTKSLFVRLSEKLLEDLKIAANKQDLTVSQLIRKCIEREIKSSR